MLNLKTRPCMVVMRASLFLESRSTLSCVTVIGLNTWGNANPVHMTIPYVALSFWDIASFVLIVSLLESLGLDTSFALHLSCTPFACASTADNSVCLLFYYAYLSFVKFHCDFLSHLSLWAIVTLTVIKYILVKNQFIDSRCCFWAQATTCVMEQSVSSIYLASYTSGIVWCCAKVKLNSLLRLIGPRHIRMTCCRNNIWFQLYL